MIKKMRIRMAAHITLLSALLTAAIGGCDSNPPGSACLDSGNPWCSNYVPPGSGGSTSDGGAGTGGNSNVHCGALPEFNCFGSCVILTSDEANCGSCGRTCDEGQTCNDGHCAWNQPPDQCTQSSESCDNIDNDCDGVIDNGYDLFADSTNCGMCGRACADGQSCNSGHCAWNEQQNGCTPSAESCNGVDDDCDNAIDEPFNLLADADNCGICGNACDSGQHCANGHCTLDTPSNNCQPVAESCDNSDNDCDGVVDNNFNLLDDEQNCGMCGHPCAANQSCLSGHCSWDTPVDQCMPVAETCNNEDDDCDGSIDDPYNLLDDPDNCGACGRSCDAGAECFNAVCRFPVPVDNCTPAPAELCNNRDDNCNGFVDEGFGLFTDPANCGMCGRDCGAGAVCDNGHCQLTDPVLNCTPALEVCDYTDNDCDGEIDELIMLLSDEANCGVCGLACGAEQVCDNGHCQWITPPVNCTPVQETCNGVDDDCDGSIDDTFNLLFDNANCGMCGRVCLAGQHCENGACALDQPVNNCVPVQEVCDNIDNNCNGFIDEGINPSTDNANCGTCGHVCPNGQACDSGHCMWILPQNGCTPAAEVCNNEDDDCDGAIDENTLLNIDPANCGVCGHVCAGGQHCSNGHCAWNVPPSNCTPAGETCNQVDDDCDGQLDEDFNLATDPANCGVCGNLCGPTEYCLNGHCANQVPVNICAPAGEVCDNVDNNCNGEVDEGINLSNDKANCGVCGRACPAGQYCANGTCAWVVPQNGCTPAPEVCDNSDNDCDGFIDEPFDLQNNTANCGLCGNACAGGQHCENGACTWDIPQNGCTPLPESCNNTDDDCDGMLDEGFPLASDPANCGICGHVCPGGQVCQNGHCQWIVPQNACTPAPEVCDNADNDCDGAIDENTSLQNDSANCGLCGHACAANQHCENGLCAWDSPVSQCGPAVNEVCDNADNDCDGLIDEPYNLLLDDLNCGICGHACALNQHCESGACVWDVPQNSCVPAAETCNGEDDDCDFVIDDPFNLLNNVNHCGACGNACAAGQSCVSGHCQWNVPQNECVPAPETCDGIDNDCDFVIDEQYNLQSDPNNCGTCGRACGGGLICQSGHCQYIVPPLSCTPVQETCNNSDDDCDGVIDDGYNPLTDINNCGLCGRVCGAGKSCIAGKCTWNYPQSSCTPAVESCDYTDNDCDGVIDNGYLLSSNNANCGVCGRACAANQHCTNGHCEWNQPQSSCAPVAETCNQIDDDCDGLIDEVWNFLNDKNHCGNCYTVCPGTQNCLNGHCYQP